MRDWALFFGQDIAAHEVLNPPMQILAEFQEDIPMGMQREFPLGQRRVCPDICGRQTCRRPHCECVHPDFVDHAWVPLNSPCRNFFRGHCHKEGGCPNADTFPEAVYAAFRQLTMKRPSTRLHYVQRRSIFRFVTRSEAMDMIQTSLTTSDTMAIKQFIMGMSWTKFPTASSYENHLARGGVPETDPRTSKGGYGRPSHRTRSPTPTRTRFPSPRRKRAPSATPTLLRPFQTAASTSSTSGSAPSFGQPSEPQPSTAPAQAPPVKPMPKDPPAHLAAPKRAPSPHNKQPARQRTESPTARFMPQAMDDVVAPEPAAAPPRKAPPPIPPDSDEDSQPAPAIATTPRKAPPAYLAPMQQRTPAPSSTSTATGPAKAPPPPLVQDDHDPWNDFSQQRAVSRGACHTRSSPSPPRVHHRAPARATA